MSPEQSSVKVLPVIAISGVASSVKSNLVVPVSLNVMLLPAASNTMSPEQSIVKSPVTSSSGVESKLKVKLATPASLKYICPPSASKVMSPSTSRVRVPNSPSLSYVDIVDPPLVPTAILR